MDTEREEGRDFTEECSQVVSKRHPVLPSAMPFPGPSPRMQLCNILQATVVIPVLDCSQCSMPRTVLPCRGHLAALSKFIGCSA